MHFDTFESVKSPSIDRPDHRSTSAVRFGEMIGVLKSKGVPVLWVGLPAVRGAKATADMLFLNSLYRDAAGKAGITYGPDIWRVRLRHLRE